MREVFRRGAIPVAAALLLALGACAPTVPREALQRSAAAHQAVVVASAPLLTSLAAAERRNFLGQERSESEVLREGNDAVVIAFAPADAGVRSSIGDPPLAGAVRQGLTVVGDYLDLLVLLADGGNIAEAQAQISVLTDSIAGIAALATGGAALPLVPVVEALQPLIENLARQRNAEELRRLVLDGAPRVDALLAQMEVSSSAIYESLVTGPSNEAEGRAFGDAAARRAIIAEMRAHEIAVGDFVWLVRSLRRELSRLAAAVRHPDSAVALGALGESSSRLLVDARAVARAAEILRASGRR